MCTQYKSLVYILILNWNGWKDTVECIESCKKLDYPNFRMLIVDNGSTDNSETSLRDHFPDIELIQTGRNLGFAGGNNVGIKYALDRGADYIWLLNNDTVVAPEALTELVIVAEDNKRAGIVGSKIYFYDEPQKIWFAGGGWRERKFFASHRGMHEIDTGQFDKICEVDYITGCSLLIKSIVIKEVGLMHEDYFLYWEDADWNATVSEHGWKILYVPGSIVWHKISSSVKNNKYLEMRYYIRNGLYFFQRHEPKRIFLLIIYIIVVFIKDKDNDYAKGHINGLIDFFRRRIGKIDYCASK